MCLVSVPPRQATPPVAPSEDPVTPPPLQVSHVPAQILPSSSPSLYLDCPPLSIGRGWQKRERYVGLDLIMNHFLHNMPLKLNYFNVNITNIIF